MNGPTLYHKIRDVVEDHKCVECSGLGYCDDACPGDIGCNTWKCTVCKGTGLNCEPREICAELEKLKE